jgi:hypothetical protein
MPSFLAKLSDNHKKTKNIIKYRAYELFGKIEKEIPERPENYENLNWLEIDKRKRCNKDEFFENLKKIKNKNFLKSVKLGQQQFEYCWPAT